LTLRCISSVTFMGSSGFRSETKMPPVG